MQEIDDLVSARLREGKSLYHVDEERLREAAPTLLVTQNLCQVCGPSGNEVTQVLKTLTPAPTILWQVGRRFVHHSTCSRPHARIHGRRCDFHTHLLA